MAAGKASLWAEELDRVVAVVNHQVILASDVDLEMRLERLLPNLAADERGKGAMVRALDRLTTQALIDQQIVEEDPQGLEVEDGELNRSLNELRQNVPACRQVDCRSDDGWARYLSTVDLTPARVAEYWRHRMALLRFIEERFRAGIRITPEEIAQYYQEKLVPEYARREDAPALEKVSQRIQEILLQQKVNLLFNDWLNSLKEEGQVEILDPLLEPGTSKAGAGPGGGVGR